LFAFPRTARRFAAPPKLDTGSRFTLRIILQDAPMNLPRPLRALSALLSFATFSLTAAEPNWPRFRGPDGLGVAAEANPPIHFAPDKNVFWKVAVPSGHSSPCIWGDRIFLTAFDREKLETLCLRRSDGAVLWRRPAPTESFEPTHRLGNPATPTPTTDGKFIYAYFGSFGLIAYDLEGTEQWRKALTQPVVEFGTSASPILAGEKLILVCDQDEGSFLLAVEARTGRTIWRVERPEFRRSFATPFVWRHDGTEELIVPGSIFLRSYNPADGAVRWTYSGTSRVACSSPVAGDGMLFSASWNVGGDADSRVTMPPFEDFMRELGKPLDTPLTRDLIPKGPVGDRFSQIDLNKDGRATREEWENMRGMFERAGNALLAIRPGGSTEISATHIAWKSTRSLPYVASPLYYRGRIFTVKNGGLASCYEAATGRVHYQDERLGAPGDYYASPIAAADRIYVASQQGVMLVLAAGDTLNVLARTELREPVMATPAIIGDTLYVRTAGHLYAFRGAP
jgi:outer membrane protein assembly factor BamB